MIAVSDKFISTIVTRTNFQQYADITLADGTDLGELGPDAFSLRNNKITDGSASSGFPFGVAVCRSAQLELINDAGRFNGYSFYGANVVLRLGLVLDDGTEEVIQAGVFTVNKPTNNIDTITLEAVDDMWKADKSYTTSLTAPVTLSDLYVDACTSCGISYATGSFNNSDVVVNVIPSSEYTFREVFGFIAMIAGGNARINRYGQMEILRFSPFAVTDKRVPLATSDASLVVTSDNLVLYVGGTDGLKNWSTLKVDEIDTSITGVKITGKDSEQDAEYSAGEEGYVLSGLNPLVGSQDVADLIGEEFIGLTFRGFEGEHTANPLYEFMDTVIVQDRNGGRYKGFITETEFVVGGMTSFDSHVDSAVLSGSSYGSSSNDVLVAVMGLIQAEAQARQKDVAAMAQNLAASGGLYYTQMLRESGTAVYLLHDKSELSASSIVLKFVADTLMLSVDGGKTYPFEISVTASADEAIITNAEALPGTYTDFLDLLDPMRYKLPGGYPYHVGYTAQSVETALKSAGLAASDFAGYISEDANGNKGLDYREFVGLLHAKIKKLEERISALEG